jgi:hypothetical protein
MNYNNYRTIFPDDANNTFEININENNTWNYKCLKFSRKIFDKILLLLFTIFMIFISLLTIYIICIVLSLFCVLFNFIFEKTMILIIGNAQYNKNFPICSIDTYIGRSCYSEASIYCI